MGYDDYYDDDHAARQKKKEKQEKAKQRKVIRFQDVTEDEIRKQGGELLSKIVGSIPKHFDKPGSAANRYGSGRKEGVVFIAASKESKETKLTIRISLALRPSAIVDYVVGAFKTKGWEAKHTFSDLEGYDFLDLSLPEDWLKRVLCIGRYNQKITEEKPVEQPKEETPDRMRFLGPETPAVTETPAAVLPKKEPAPDMSCY